VVILRTHLLWKIIALLNLVVKLLKYSHGSVRRVRENHARSAVPDCAV